ncbi:MAG TPA: hypothetical protein VHL80_07435, partial [Polyangia bacterium]|nr:hypothetical protein [Polyangia bacterium]
RGRAAGGGPALAAPHLARGELRRAMSVRAARPAAVRAARPAAFVGSLLVVVAAAPPARAALPLTLTWVAPTGCPTAADVRGEVERLVRFPHGQEPKALVAEGRVEDRDGRWRLRLHTERDGVPGERELEADSCASLAHAATLVMALAFGVGENAPPPAPPPVEERPRPPPRPRVVEAPPPPPPPVETPPPPPPSPPRPAAPPVVVAAPATPRPPTAWSIGAEMMLGGPLPSGPASRLAGWGAGVGLAATRGRLRAELRARAWLPTDDAITGTSTRMQSSGEGLAASVCRIAARPRWGALALCATGGSAAIRGASTGGLTSTPRTAPWSFAGFAIDERLRLWRGLHLEVRLELDTSLTRPEFALGSGPEPQAMITTVYAVPRVVPVLGAGLSFDL